MPYCIRWNYGSLGCCSICDEWYRGHSQSTNSAYADYFVFDAHRKVLEGNKEYGVTLHVVVCTAFKRDRDIHSIYEVRSACLGIRSPIDDYVRHSRVCIA